MKTILFTSFIVLHWFALCVNAEENVRLEILADKVSVSEGDTVTIIGRFVMKDGWHIYWKNPGDFGLPTKISATDSESFDFDELQYPTPIRFVQSGGQTGYGYEKEAQILLPGRFLGAENLHGKIEVPVAAHWLNCSATMCVPASMKKTMTFSIGKTEEDAIGKQFLEKAQASIPKAALPSEFEVTKAGKHFLVRALSTNSGECFPGHGVNLLGIAEEGYRFQISKSDENEHSEVLCRLGDPLGSGRVIPLGTVR